MSAPVEPKRPQSAYFLYVNATREQVQTECGKKAFGEVTKLQADRWKALSETEKAPFEKQASSLKAQYEKDLAAFKEAGGVKGQARAEKRDAKKGKADKKAEKKANKDRPKKPAGGAFGVWINQHRAEIMKSLPAGSKCTAVAPVASARWKEMSEADKKPYEDKYQALQKVYQAELKTWKESKAENAAAKDAASAEDAEGGEPSPQKPAQKRKSDTAQALEAPPQKRGRGRGRGRGASKDGSRGSLPGPALGAEILKQAGDLGLEAALLNLAARDGLTNFPADKMLAALRQSGGLINKAKAALMAGA